MASPSNENRKPQMNLSSASPKSLILRETATQNDKCIGHLGSFRQIGPLTEVVW